jgi:subtilisin family serine protease
MSLGICGALPARASFEAPGAIARVEFREPAPAAYLVELPRGRWPAAAAALAWLAARREDSSGPGLEFGQEVVVQVEPDVVISSLLRGRALTHVRQVIPGVYLARAPEAWTALREAAALARLPEVRVSHPVKRRPLRKHGSYAPVPNDPHFSQQWNYENRADSGAVLGADLNARAAWPFTCGEGIILAVVDDGIELTHLDLVSRAAVGLQRNFGDGTTNSLPEIDQDRHGTAVAGLAVAAQNNQRGMSGIAPGAQLASWKIFRGDNLTPGEPQMMEMFQAWSNVVSVQNHSWGNAGREQVGPTFLESIGISNALTFGREGRGVVMVRSAGNGRADGGNANDDGYANDPRVIAVASVWADGGVASYSNPGACVWVAAPGGDPQDRPVFTTDRSGPAGYHTGIYADDTADYVHSAAVYGTSLAAPQVAGVVALMLSVNPQLTSRDVQLVLALAARHVGLRDPDSSTNGAGFRISHNVGFGVPDAGQAVTLARGWVNRPPLTILTRQDAQSRPIPDAGSGSPPLTIPFSVTETLVCEHLGVRLRTDHSRRGDLRITLTSPQGTRSTLQHPNRDASPGPTDWTYYSVRYLGETSSGLWTVAIADEVATGTGRVQETELILRGVRITDGDRDGLDDDWETAHLGSTTLGARNDPDADGASNAREQLAGTDPGSSGLTLQLDLSPWNDRLMRLSWTGVDSQAYEILTGSDVTLPPAAVTPVPGRFPETEWFTPRTSALPQFFQVRTAGQ